MHIAIATAEFVTEECSSGGLANYTANIARILRDKGNEVSIFIPSDEEANFAWENGIMVYRVCFKEQPAKLSNIKVRFVRRCLLFAWNLLGKSILINKKIRKVSEQEKIDIVHFCSSESLAMFRTAKIPAVVRLSTYLPAMRQAQCPIFDYEKSINSINFLERVQLISTKRGDCIFGPSHNAAKLTERKIRKTVQVIESPFCINNERIDYSVYNQFLCGKKYFIFFGTLGYLKGIHTIASILKQFFENYPDYYFVFVGNNQKVDFGGKEIDAMEYVYECVPQFRDKVLYFPATKNKEQLYGLVKNAEASVLPSRFDNLPNTCIEAMALGQIVIGTNGASFEQLIEDEANGFLIERENEQQLYEKIVKVIEMNENDKAKMKEKAKGTIGRLHPDNVYPQLMELYEQAIKKRNKK